MRKRKTSEEIFFDDIYNSIKNLFIKDPNYSSGFYGHSSEIRELEAVTKRKAVFLLEHMEKIKHLIVNEYE